MRTILAVGECGDSQVLGNEVSASEQVNVSLPRPVERGECPPRQTSLDREEGSASSLLKREAYQMSSSSSAARNRGLEEIIVFSCVAGDSSDCSSPASRKRREFLL